MYKLFFLSTIFLHVIVHLHAQNLVPNPSFEMIAHCPAGHNLGNLDWVVDNWHTPPGSVTTPDLFSMCYNGTSPEPPYQNVAVPENFMGIAHPKSGDNYMGLLLKYGLLTGGENLQVQLTEPLVAGQAYLCGFNIQRADSAQYQINRAGMHLSTIAEYQNGNSVMSDLVPQIENTTGILYDSLNWLTIQGVYIATGGEQYITIGNFFSNENTLTDSIDIGATGGAGWNVCCRGYYLFDDVFVIPYFEHMSAVIPAAVCSNDTITLEAHGSLSYNWYVNDTWYSADSVITLTLSTGTTISVQGYMDTVTQYVAVQTDCPPDCQGIPVLPNVFSPNGDNVNDFFSVTGVSPDCFQLTILNRWGNIVYQSSGENNSWDGRDQSGNALSEGVYFVTVEWNTYGEEQKEERGFVALIK
jgi:gliding motility-associated-like protein